MVYAMNNNMNNLFDFSKSNSKQCSNKFTLLNYFCVALYVYRPACVLSTIVLDICHPEQFERTTSAKFCQGLHTPLHGAVSQSVLIH